MKLKRYRLSVKENKWGPSIVETTPADDGEWACWEDVEEAVDGLRLELDQLRREIAEKFDYRKTIIGRLPHD